MHNIPVYINDCEILNHFKFVYISFHTYIYSNDEHGMVYSDCRLGCGYLIYLVNITSKLSTL